MDPRFATTEYVVEATSYEKLSLWRMYAEKNEWIQDTAGLCLCITQFGKTNQEKRPVNVSFQWARINGMNVMFWHPTSQLVDYVAIEAWLKEHCYPYKNTGFPARCDADNFGNCLGYSKRDRSPITETAISEGLKFVSIDR